MPQFKQREKDISLENMSKITTKHVKNDFEDLLLYLELPFSHNYVQKL